MVGNFILSSEDVESDMFQPFAIVASDVEPENPKVDLEKFDVDSGNCDVACHISKVSVVNILTSCLLGRYLEHGCIF